MFIFPLLFPSHPARHKQLKSILSILIMAARLFGSIRFLVILGAMLFLTLLVPLADAKTYCSFDGPDVSDDSLELTDFSVTGPDNLTVGSALTVTFDIRNTASEDINFTDKGIFAAIRDKDNANHDTAGVKADKTLSASVAMHFSKAFTIDQTGLWDIWPSYEYWRTSYSPVLKKNVTLRFKGPDYWNGCELSVCPEYCENNIRYYAPYVGQDNDCVYTQETCSSGCDQAGIQCAQADTEPPTVAAGYSPLPATTISNITFTAGAMDENNVTRIRIWISGAIVKDCPSPEYLPEDNAWRCIFNVGLLPEGVYSYKADAFDQSGNRGISEERTINVSKVSLPPVHEIPLEQHPIPCLLSGRLYNFTYYSKTVQVQVCEAESISSSCSPTPPFTCLPPLTICKQNGTVDYLNVTRLWVGEEAFMDPGPLDYTTTLACNRTYMITPMYQPYGEQCPWQGSFKARKSNYVLTNVSNRGYDFDFSPMDLTPPQLQPTFVITSSSNPSQPDNWSLVVRGTDPKGIASIRINGTDGISMFQSDYSGPLLGPVAATSMNISKQCNASPCELPLLHGSAVKGHELDLRLKACDLAGNSISTDYNATVPEGIGDLSIKATAPVQVLYGAPLVKGKDTAFRIKVDSTFAYPVETRIRLTLPDSEWDKGPEAGAMAFTAPPGWQYPEIWGPIVIPANAKDFEIILPILPDWQKNRSFDFATDPNGIIAAGFREGVYWPDIRAAPKPKANQASFSADIDPSNEISETNERNNHADYSSTDIGTMRGWSFCFAPMLFNLKKSPMESEGSYAHYLSEMGYSDISGRYNDVFNYENTHHTGFAPLSMALNLRDIERLKDEARMQVDYFTSVYPVADYKVSYYFMEDKLYFLDDYIVDRSPERRLCPTSVEAVNHTGEYYADKVWWFRGDLKAAIQAEKGCDFVVFMPIFGCCGQSMSSYNTGYANVDAGILIHGNDWNHELAYWSNDTPSQDLGTCFDWTFAYDGASDQTLAHEFNHAQLDFEPECYSCYPSFGNSGFCGDCLADEGFSLYRWRSYEKGVWIGGTDPQSGQYSNYMTYRGNAYFADAVGWNGWNRLNGTRWREGDNVSFGGYLSALIHFANESDPKALQVRGWISKNGSSGFYPFIMLENSTLEQSDINATYSIVLLGQSNNELGSFTFSPSFIVTSQEPVPPMPMSTYYFSYRVGWVDGTKRIELRDQSGMVLASRDVSANKPQVRIIYPNGNETLAIGQDYTIKWEGSDSDNDKLTYSLGFSSDGGKTWNPLDWDIEKTEYAFSTAGFDEGSGYLIKVRSSDGVNTAEDASDSTFSIRPASEVPQQPPEAEGLPSAYTIAIAAGVVIALTAIVWFLARPGAKRMKK